jgi:hypothetical protein
MPGYERGDTGLYEHRTTFISHEYEAIICLCPDGGGPGFESPRAHHPINPTNHSIATSRRLTSAISPPHIGFHISFKTPFHIGAHGAGLW